MGYQISALACACYATSCCLLFSFLACLHCRDSEQGCAWEEQTTLRRSRNQQLAALQQQLHEGAAEPESTHHQ